MYKTPGRHHPGHLSAGGRATVPGMDWELDLQTQRASAWGWVTRQGPRTESGTEYKLGAHYPKYSEVLMKWWEKSLVGIDMILTDAVKALSQRNDQSRDFQAPRQTWWWVGS